MTYMIHDMTLLGAMFVVWNFCFCIV